MGVRVPGLKWSQNHSKDVLSRELKIEVMHLCGYLCVGQHGRKQ